MSRGLPTREAIALAFEHEASMYEKEHRQAFSGAQISIDLRAVAFDYRNRVGIGAGK